MSRLEDGKHALVIMYVVRSGNTSALLHLLFLLVLLVVLEMRR
jgi:hypothetical protein